VCVSLGLKKPGDFTVSEGHGYPLVDTKLVAWIDQQPFAVGNFVLFGKMSGFVGSFMSVLDRVKDFVLSSSP
jgi:hypothetical protein